MCMLVVCAVCWITAELRLSVSHRKTAIAERARCCDCPDSTTVWSVLLQNSVCLRIQASWLECLRPAKRPSVVSMVGLQTAVLKWTLEWLSPIPDLSNCRPFAIAKVGCLLCLQNCVCLWSALLQNCVCLKIQAFWLEYLHPASASL